MAKATANQAAMAFAIAIAYHYLVMGCGTWIRTIRQLHPRRSANDRFLRIILFARRGWVILPIQPASTDVDTGTDEAAKGVPWARRSAMIAADVDRFDPDRVISGPSASRTKPVRRPTVPRGPTRVERPSCSWLPRPKSAENGSFRSFDMQRYPDTLTSSGGS